MKIHIAVGISFPVYVRAKDDGTVLRVDDSRRMNFMEPIDVRNSLYESWDSMGRILSLSASKETFFGPGDIFVSPTGVEINEDELRILIATAART